MPLLTCSATVTVLRRRSIRATRRPATSPHRRPKTAPSQTIGANSTGIVSARRIKSTGPTILASFGLTDGR